MHSELVVHALQRVDVHALVGQTSLAKALLRGEAHASHGLVQCFSSDAHELRIQPNAPFALSGGGLAEVSLALRPVAAGRRQYHSKPLRFSHAGSSAASAPSATAKYTPPPRPDSRARARTCDATACAAGHASVAATSATQPTRSQRPPYGPRCSTTPPSVCTDPHGVAPAPSSAALGAGGASWPLKADLYSPSAAIAASIAAASGPTLG